MIYQNDIFPWNDNSICLSCCLQSMVAYGCLWCLFVAASAFTFTTKFPTQASGRSSRERRKTPSEKHPWNWHKKKSPSNYAKPSHFASVHSIFWWLLSPTSVNKYEFSLGQRHHHGIQTHLPRPATGPRSAHGRLDQLWNFKQNSVETFGMKLCQVPSLHPFRMGCQRESCT